MIMLQRLRSLKGNQHRSRLYQLKVEDHKGAVQEDEVQEDEVQEVREEEVREVREEEVREEEVREVREEEVREVREEEVQGDEVQGDEVREATGVVDVIILGMNRQMSFLKKYYV